MFDSSTENIRRIVQLAEERASLLERLAEIDKELMSGLPTLLTSIAARSQTPLKMTDFIIRVIRAGYTTKATDFSLIIYAGLKMLVEKGVLKRDRDSQGYEFTRPA